ncbi:MAG: 3-hydroxyacyl-CoA dehydrogenase NAD-binding domain-containing protein [Dysosmobacter sp.]
MPKCQVGVVGTGVMATGTATLLICNRYPAILYGRTQESCERGLRSVRAALDDLIAAGVLQEAQRDKALTYLSATTAYEDLAGCQFVIESAAETIDTKREVMAHLEAVCAPEAILSSTTSAISANEIAAEMKHPERFLVAHSWNPPHLVPLVEIVRCAATTQETVDREVALLEDLGRVPVVLKKDVPGFIGKPAAPRPFPGGGAHHRRGDRRCGGCGQDDPLLHWSAVQLHRSDGVLGLPPRDAAAEHPDVSLPHLCNADRPSHLLDEKTATGEDLYHWTPERETDYELRKRKPFYRFATVKLDDEEA